MVKRMGMLGDRVLGLIVPKTQAAACGCWIAGYCTLPDGTQVPRECCKIGGHLYCEHCSDL
jgi:hypothetical protein